MKHQQSIHLPTSLHLKHLKRVYNSKKAALPPILCLFVRCCITFDQTISSHPFITPVKMSRASRGCKRCRERRVKVSIPTSPPSSPSLTRPQCDEGRPSCKRCVARNELCEGYRDETTLLFRSENERAALRVARDRKSVV